MFITCPFSVSFDPLSGTLADLTDCDGEYHLTYEDVSGTVLERNGSEGSMYISEPVDSPAALVWAKDCTPEDARRILSHECIDRCPLAFVAVLRETVSLDDAAEREAALDEERHAYEFRRWQEDQYGKGI